MRFNVVPNYTYLKMKMSDPLRVIKESTSFQVAYACERANYELVSAESAARELAELQRDINPQDGPDAPKAVSGTFKSEQDTKNILVADDDASKSVRIGATLSDKQEGTLVNLLQANHNVFA
jgi:hypothetical protein